MRPKERPYLAHRQGNPLLGLLPREYAHFGLRREHRALHDDGVRMRRHVIRQDQYRRPAIAHEIARHRRFARSRSISACIAGMRSNWTSSVC